MNSEGSDVPKVNMEQSDTAAGRRVIPISLMHDLVRRRSRRIVLIHRGAMFVIFMFIMVPGIVAMIKPGFVNGISFPASWAAVSQLAVCAVVFAMLYRAGAITKHERNAIACNLETDDLEALGAKASLLVAPTPFGALNVDRQTHDAMMTRVMKLVVENDARGAVSISRDALSALLRYASLRRTMDALPFASSRRSTTMLSSRLEIALLEQTAGPIPEEMRRHIRTLASCPCSDERDRAVRAAAMQCVQRLEQPSELLRGSAADVGSTCLLRAESADTSE